MPLQQAGMFANACGAFCCTKMETRGAGTLQEVQEVMKQAAHNL